MRGTGKNQTIQWLEGRWIRSRSAAGATAADGPTAKSGALGNSPMEKRTEAAKEWPGDLGEPITISFQNIRPMASVAGILP
jgi:hypothetical protein